MAEDRVAAQSGTGQERLWHLKIDELLPEDRLELDVELRLGRDSHVILDLHDDDCGVGRELDTGDLPDLHAGDAHFVAGLQTRGVFEFGRDLVDTLQGLEPIHREREVEPERDEQNGDEADKPGSSLGEGFH